MNRRLRNHLPKLARLAQSATILAGQKLNSGRTPVFLDIGGRGGLQPKWEALYRLGLVDPILIEPDAHEAEKLKIRYPKVIDWAVGSRHEKRKLYLTQEPGRSSLLCPLACVGPYSVVDTIEVEVRPIGELVAGSIDWMKLDVQGFELEVMKGGEELLHKLVGIEIEVTTKPTYQNQATVQMIIDWLRPRGFVLKKLRPFGVSDEELHEFDAFFVNRETLDSPESRAWTTLNGIMSKEDLPYQPW